MGDIVSQPSHLQIKKRKCSLLLIYLVQLVYSSFSTSLPPSLPAIGRPSRTGPALRGAEESEETEAD